MEEVLELRPAVAAFAQTMERQLRRHDATRGPAGWENDDARDLFAHQVEEICEVAALLGYSERELMDLVGYAFGHLPPEAFVDFSPDRVEEEEGDVGNMGMMVAAAFRWQAEGTDADA